jgi:hypothetical protein
MESGHVIEIKDQPVTTAFLRMRVDLTRYPGPSKLRIC